MFIFGVELETLLVAEASARAGASFLCIEIAVIRLLFLNLLF